MPTAAEAEEHLRVIRSLMEKATIYRAVSAPTALAGGIAAVVVASGPFKVLFFDQVNPITSFQVRWLLALLVTLLVNGYLILREARRRGDPVISPGMRAAFRAFLPPFLCGGFFFTFFSPADAPSFAAIFYGLGLLATGHFAPRSITWLGWSFCLAGLAAFYWSLHSPAYVAGVADVIMVATFGGFHFIYAACTWPRRATAVQSAQTPRTDV